MSTQCQHLRLRLTTSPKREDKTMYFRLIMNEGWREERKVLGAEAKMMVCESMVMIDALRQYAENKDNKDKLLAKSMVDDIEREKERWDI